jgi:HK97 family phage portal protein
VKAIVKAARSRGKQATDWHGGGWQPIGGYGGATGSPFRVTQALHTYGGTDESSSAVFACVVKIANELAGYEHALADVNGDLLKPTEANQELFDLIEEPVADTTYFDWVADVATDVELVGNSYWLKDRLNGLGQPEGLERFDPSYVTIVTNDQDQKIGYGVLVRGRMIPFGLDDIIHYRTRNPLNRHRGMGTVEAIFREINAELAETAHITSFFQNGARIAGVLTIPEELGEGEFQRLRQQVDDQYGGPHNAYKTLLATGASDYKPISATPVASGVVELRRASLDAIYKGFGVPEFILGGTAQGGVYKMSEAQFIFYRNMLPRGRRFQERTTLNLTALWDGTRFVVKPELSEPPSERMQTAAAMFGAGAALNEGREHAGLPRIEDPAADVPLMPAGVVPFGTVVNPVDGQVRQLTTEPIQVPRVSDGAKAHAGLPLPWAFPRSRPNGAKDTIEAEAEEDELVESPKLPTGYEQRGDIIPKEADPEAVRIVVNEQATFLERATPEMANSMREFFQGQRSRVLQALVSEGRQAARNHSTGGGSKRPYREKALRDLFDRILPDENVKIAEHYLGALDALGEYALAMPRRVLGMSISWSQQHPYIWSARGAMGKLITRINETTRSLINAEIELGLSRGYSVQQIANGTPEGYAGIQGVFDEAGAARAEVIARTESAFLFNAAATAAYREENIAQVEVLDGEFDAKCRDANGSIWTIREAELHPIEHPNCVRAFVPVIELPKEQRPELKGTDWMTLGGREQAVNYPGYAALVAADMLEAAATHPARTSAERAELDALAIEAEHMLDAEQMGLWVNAVAEAPRAGLTVAAVIEAYGLKYDPDQPRNPTGASGGIGGQWRSQVEGQLEGIIGDAFEGLPPQDGKQEHADPDDLYSSAERAFDSYNAVLDLGKGISADLEADTFRLYGDNPAKLDKTALKNMGEAIASAPDRNYIIVAHRKEREQFSDKVAGKYGGDASSITDLVRGSILVDDPRRIGDVIDSIKKNAKEQGWEVVEAETTQVNIVHANRPPGKYSSGYRDSKLLISNGDHIAEVQVMATRMWLAKDGPPGWYRSEPDTNGHSMYEEQRGLDLSTPEGLARWTELNNRQRRLYAEAWKAVIQRMQSIDMGDPAVESEE